LKNPSIRQLTVGLSNLDDQALAGLSPDLRLESLALSGNPDLRGHSFDRIAAIKTLKKLALEGAGVEGIGLVHLKDHPNLEYLSLFATRIAGKNLQALARNTALKVLRLDGKEIGDDALQALGGFEHLEELTLYTAVTDTGFAFLKGANNLKVLTTNRPLTETSVRHLAALPKLEELKAPLPALTKALVRELAALTSLKVVDPRRIFPPEQAALLQELSLAKRPLLVRQIRPTK
jgi:hypothetical protein